MAIKFKLEPAPTFEAHVPVPVPGARPERIRFTFKRRNKKDFLAWLAKFVSNPTAPGAVAAQDAEAAAVAVASGVAEAPALTEDNELATTMDIVCGWELTDPFDEENVTKLLQNYLGSGNAIFLTYLRENGQARLGN